MTRPRIRRQYSVDVLGNIRERLTSLAGFSAFCFEMTQNAEDAGSEWLDFRFHDTHLEVANSSSFSQDDWDRVTEIAHGGKPEENIGTFGVGFTSVFQYTDEPSILSSGIKVTISLQRIADSQDETIVDEDCTHPPGTTLLIPWAFEESEVRQRIDRPVVSAEAIRDFFEEACNAVPESLVFLRRLKRATLQFGEQRVRIDREDDPSGPSITKRSVTVTRLTSDECLSTEWLLYRHTPDADEYPDCGKKTPEVAIGLSPRSRGASSARLYSYLPTQHRTGLPFHVHGSFFAKSDRKGIERDGESDHVTWNGLLLREVPGMSTRMMKSVIESLGPRAALQILPRSNYRSDDFEELNDIVSAIVEAVQGGMLLLYDRHGVPAAPGDLFLVSDLDATAIQVAESCGARFPHDDFKDLVGWLKRFGVKELHHSQLASLPLFQTLAATGTLDEADERFRDQEFRASIYQFISDLLDVDDDESATQESISRLHCAVACGGGVVALDCLWTASDREHRCFVETFAEDDFWSLEDQGSLPDSLRDRLPAFGATDAVEHVTTEDVFQSWFVDDPSRLTVLYQCVNHWLRSGVSEEGRGLLRSAAIWNRADGRFVSGRTLDLPNADFDDPLELGVVFAHPLGPNASTEDLQTARYCLKELGAEPLSFRSYCLKHIPEYVFKHDDDAEAKTAKCAAVLNVLRSRLREFQDDDEIVNALQVLQIVPSSDELFHAPNELYWPSDVLDAVFGQGEYLTPSHEMPDVKPPWQEFYEILGIDASPRVEDVVARIRELASEERSSSRESSLQHLFNHLDTCSEDWSDADADHVRSLRDLPCIPVNPKDGGLAKPNGCHISELHALIGDQGPCVAFFFRPRAVLREALGLSDKAPVSLVIANLRDRVERQASVPQRIYEYLNQHAAEPAVRQLHGERCIDIGEGRVLAGREIFFEPVSFGRYRYHLPEELAEFTDLFEVLGVRHVAQIDPVALVEVLEDISSEWAPGNRMPDQEALAVIDHVLVMLSEFQDDAALVSAIASIRSSKCLPRADGLLVEPAQLVMKDHQGFAKEFGTRLGSSLIEKRPRTWQLFHDVFDVPMLSDIVEETLREPERCVLNQRAMQALDEKRPFILRIVESLRGNHPSGWRTNKLDTLEIYTAAPLEVEYRLTACAPTRVGPRPAKSVYQSAGHRILVAQGESYDSTAFARAYADALNAEIEVSSIVPLLRLVFESDDADMLAMELSEMGVDLLADDIATTDGVQSEEIHAIGVEEQVSDEHAESDDSEEGSPTTAVSSEADPSDGAVEGGTTDTTRAAVSGRDDRAEEPEGSEGEGWDDEEADSGDAWDGDTSSSSSRDDGEFASDAAGGDGPSDRGSRGRNRAKRGTRRRGGASERAGDSRRREASTTRGKQEGSPYEASQNWFRVRVARNRDEFDAEEQGRRKSELNDDTRARDVAIAFEESRGWKAIAAPKMQQGYDVVSTNPATGEKRRIEVKGASLSWTDDATVRLSYSQFHDAYDFEGPNEDYWLYVIDRLASDKPRVFAIQNPAKSSYWFYLQAQDWVEDSPGAVQGVAESTPETLQADAAGPEDISYLRECVPQALHVVLDAIGNHPAPIPQFELDEGDEILVVDLAWPARQFGIVEHDTAESAPSSWTLLSLGDVDSSAWVDELARHLGDGAE